MGFYECIYECGCVSIQSSLDNFLNTTDAIVCDMHNIKSGNIISCNLTRFINQFKKKRSSFELLKCMAKVINVHDISLNNKKQRIVQLEIDYDCNKLDPTKLIYFFDLNDEPLWKPSSENKCIITVPYYYVKIEKNVYSGNDKYYDWHKNTVKER